MNELDRTNSEDKPLRLGVVSYLNMQPLIYGLEKYPREALDLKLAPPSRLADWLVAGELDMGMIPVAAIFDYPEWSIAPGAMIGARGAVASVLLLGQGEPRTWRTLRPDSQSRSSNALARVVLHGLLEINPVLGELLPFDATELPTQPRAGEAIVAIGTRALRWRPQWEAAGGTVLDLGEAWYAWTGLPAVFALWAVRPGAHLGDWPAQLEQLKRGNLARLRQIAADWPAHREDQLSAAEAEYYLSQNIDYDFDAAAREGLERFYREGRALGLFNKDWRWNAYKDA